jgi:RimJ/RimL family protein N-acetyltransferase
MVTKTEMLSGLPLVGGTLTIREWTRHDVDLLASWPAYPFPYKGFGFSFAQIGPAERDRLFHARQSVPATVTLVADHSTQPAIGYIAARSIDWATGTIGNLGARVHPAWCGRGVGTSILRRVTRWSFQCGIRLWRLDVAACNMRAIRCYERVGFVRTGEMWRSASDLRDIDLAGPRYDYIRRYTRRRDGEVELCFTVMELERGLAGG